MTAPELLFCAVCQVSVARSEVESGAARRSPRGRLFCPACVRSTPEERLRRRASFEAEFADDAPVAAARTAARAAADVPPPLPPGAAAREPVASVAAAEPSREAVLIARVGELERRAFRAEARLAALEAQVADLARRAG